MKFRFSMRTLFAMVTLAAVISASFLPGMAERYQIGRLRDRGVQIFTEPRGQYLLRYFAGDSISERAIYVHLREKEVDDALLTELSGFPYLEVLTIKSPKFTDAQLEQLKNLPNLTSLVLVDTQSTDDGIKKLREACPHLKRVSLEASPAK